MAGIGKMDLFEGKKKEPKKGSFFNNRILKSETDQRPPFLPESLPCLIPESDLGLPDPSAKAVKEKASARIRARDFMNDPSLDKCLNRIIVDGIIFTKSQLVTRNTVA